MPDVNSGQGNESPVSNGGSCTESDRVQAPTE